MSLPVNDSETSSADELQDPDIDRRLSRPPAQVSKRSNRSTRGNTRSARGLSINEGEISTRSGRASTRSSRGTSRNFVERALDDEDDKDAGTSARRSWRELADSEDEDEEDAKRKHIHSSSAATSSVEVRMPDVVDRSEYTVVKENNTVDSVVKEYRRSGNRLWYSIRYEDGRKDEVSFETLIQLINGENALDIFNASSSDDNSTSPPKAHHREDSTMSTSASGRPVRERNKPNYIGMVGQEDPEYESPVEPRTKKRRLESLSTSRRENMSRRNRLTTSRSASLEDAPHNRASRGAKRSPSPQLRSTRSSNRSRNYKETQDFIQTDTPASDDDSDDLIVSDLIPRPNTRASRGRAKPKTRTSTRDGKQGRDQDSSSDELPGPTRVSGRSNKTARNMRENAVDEEVYADEDAAPTASKVISIREVFKPLPSKSEFVQLHNMYCDVCDGHGNTSNKGTSPLIYCQGCTTSIHKVCLGYRSQRDHRVTKVANDEFVMQCRRCIGLARKKDSTAPRLDMCQSCREPGESCAEFSKKLTTKQEEKLREENKGEDPITPVSPDLVNNPDKLLFRCRQCQRGFHFNHLPPLDADTMTDTECLSRDEAIEEYTEYFQCKTCADTTKKVQTLVAWRPLDVAAYDPAKTGEMVPYDDKEYLVKWEKESYFRCTWRPGSWVWGIVASVMRKAFDKRDEGANLAPKMTMEDAVPEEFLRMEIVLDVEYTSRVSIRTEEVDKARVKEVDRVFVKFYGLGYDEAVWEQPPEESDVEGWAAFVAAYNEYVAGQYFKQPPPAMNDRINKFRALPFEKKVFMEKQPESLTGGEMMAYQMEGMNWLLYKYHEEKNVILADEMGLGKTIQVIALLTTLIKDKPKCWPFLVVVPNSTCPNWRREIKKWAPSLRVVAYYGERTARDTAMKYELYPDGCKDMRAHIVVTSFDAPVDDHSKAFFRKIKWTGLIVDEGQRLKNDKNLLYGALSALKVGFKILMTGTPLQNNKRELFNLLQFLDTSIDAEQLDEEYAELTNENLPQLHDRIRPFFLRRTKAQVLKFLPPMAQVIVPVTMSLVQKKLYKSILAKNPELIKAIFGNSKTVLRSTDRGNLNNILMQLRKCLCHPFIYSEAIEERALEDTVLHRNLVDASSKLQLLEIMLPKLHERGHRVLIFSQFLSQLDIIEDFLLGLGLQHERLDGTIGTLEKQRRIDAFNAPESSLFAFLLSTRAGGVGINLATADTVIIMDPDFNPHQDIQALSRAHRIGQKKKVLVFQLMTKDSAEEKIVQIGRKKMALDHVLIESMEADDDAGLDLENILKHGAEALFNDDDGNDIHYDSASVDKLLDRSEVEDTNTGTTESAESQFSFARIWANDKGVLTDDVGDADSEDGGVPNPSVWDAILKQREADAALEAAKRQQTFGRGKRQRQAVDYQAAGAEGEEASGEKALQKGKKGKQTAGVSEDEDFAAVGESDQDDESDVGEPLEPNEVPAVILPPGKSLPPRDSAATGRPKKVDEFKRAEVNPIIPRRDLSSFSYASPILPPIRPTNSEGPDSLVSYCNACQQSHISGKCPLRTAGVEHCNLCGLAHYGGMYTCSKLDSEIEIRKMLDALKRSTEPRDIVNQTRAVLRHKMTEAVQRKKIQSQDGTNGNTKARPNLSQQTTSPYFQPPPAAQFSGLPLPHNMYRAPGSYLPGHPPPSTSAPPTNNFQPPPQGYSGPPSHGYTIHPPQGLSYPPPPGHMASSAPQGYGSSKTGSSGHGHPTRPQPQSQTTQPQTTTQSQSTQPPSNSASFKVMLPKDMASPAGPRKPGDEFRHYKPQAP